jgi:predicted alternative tryptophan synthase beta-subunit
MPDTASRRALLVGLAVMPAINATTVAASVAPDPIFAAIARYRAALAALATIDQLAEPAAYAAVDQEMFAAADVMATTVPQTVSGAKALLDVTIADAEADGEQGRWIDTLKVLRVALDRLAALSA